MPSLPPNIEENIRYFYSDAVYWLIEFQAVKDGRKTQTDSDTEFIGPVVPKKVMLSHKEMGTQLLPGEGKL